MSSVFQFVAVLLVLNLANVAQAADDICSTLTPMYGFNIKPYLGKWYENRRYVRIGPENPKCVSSVTKYSYSGLESVFFEVTNVNGTLESSTLKGKVIHERGSGRYTIIYPPENERANGEYVILDTDYNSYAVLYTCNDGFVTEDNPVLAWIYTREAIPKDSVVRKALKVAKKAGFVTSQFEKIQQKGCRYPKTYN